MRKILTSLLLSFTGLSSLAGTMILNERPYNVDTISRREVGPGIIHTRFRITDYPLNVNTLEMDLNNPYNRIENNQPQDTIGRQERLADAYKRHKLEGKNPIAGANANFWVVSGHGFGWAFMLGTNFGANVYNGKIMTETNGHANQWSGGPGYACGTAIDTDKKLWVDHMSWYGEAKSPIWDKPIQIIQFNKICNEGELAVFTSNYGKNRQMLTNDTNDNIFLNVDEGQVWAVNKDMTATVQAVSHNKANEVVGEYDLCLTGSGAYKPYLQQLKVGDKVTINHAWTVMRTGEKPNIENMVEGNAMVMDRGELTDLNYIDGYCSMVYSRCAYGASADGKKLYIITIDKSTDQYGASEGCPTDILCQILRYAGCANICNMDAGGSAQMMINGEVINSTTEGTPRAVSTSWMLYSTAPRDNKIARIAFDQYDLTIPVLSSCTPKMLGYNEYGDLVDEDVKGFTLSCDKSIGTINGETIKAGKTPAYGTITATYNGQSVTHIIKTVTAEMALRIKPTIYIDGYRQYPIEVQSNIGRNTYLYDHADLDWSTTNPTIASTQNGILKGIIEGETELRCTLDDATDVTNVKVEIADKPILSQPFTGWTMKGTGAKDVKLSTDGVISMNYTGGRGQKIIMAKQIQFYSLPDKITLEFTSSIPLDYIQVDFRAATTPSANYITYGKDTKFEANKRYEIELNISDFGDPKDLIYYPISLRQIGFFPPSIGVNTGSQEITIHGLNAHYNNFSGVNETLTDKAGSSIKIFPTVVQDATINISTAADMVSINLYNQAGMMVKNQSFELNGNTSSLDLSGLPSGIYILKVDTKTDNKTQKIIIK